ncbi:UspA domain-containing protein [Nitrosotalea devaniterrae]|uniref:UspA domain-containing protein n=1 Tax=Nitrosotalea devaniterrae TaxID=1078905 RepID=A0A128A473_9ARCH|nr:UspA domain-containing protein [Candidatus Nitrosotalea devanaterra]
MVPHDKSESASRAFEYAIDLAGKYNSSISIVTCVSVQAPTDPYFGAAYIETAKLLKEDAAKSISGLEPRLKELKIQYKTDVLEVRSVTDSLVSYAESHNVDLIVMGSRGFGGFKKLLLGSVASGVSQHSKCPVLIVK